MSWVAVAIGGSAAVGAGAGLWGAHELAGASQDAATKQADAATQAANIQAQAIGQANQAQTAYGNRALDITQQQFGQQQQNLQPYMQAGSNALTQADNIAQNYQPFDLSKAQLDPGYSFRLKQGLDAIQNSAAANGGMFSGNTMKAMNDYAGQSASQEYQNAFNRYQVERQARLDPLMQIAGMGQNAAFGANQASQGYADNAGGILSGMGNSLAQGSMGIGNAYAQGRLGAANAVANGEIGSANAWASGAMGMANGINGAIGSFTNYGQSQNLLNALRSQNGGSKTWMGPYSPQWYGG